MRAAILRSFVRPGALPGWPVQRRRDEWWAETVRRPCRGLAKARSAKISPRKRRAHMYAVIKTGGKQYKVAAGDKIKVEQIAADVGQEIVIDQVLAVGEGAELKVGSPWVAGASVTAKVLGTRPRTTRCASSSSAAASTIMKRHGSPAALHRNRDHRHQQVRRSSHGT
jgi:ribosomal protein L21